MAHNGVMGVSIVILRPPISILVRVIKLHMTPDAANFYENEETGSTFSMWNHN
jgi:hypothetical protein